MYYFFDLLSVLLLSHKREKYLLSFLPRFFSSFACRFSSCEKRVESRDEKKIYMSYYASDTGSDTKRKRLQIIDFKEMNGCAKYNILE